MYSFLFNWKTYSSIYLKFVKNIAYKEFIDKNNFRRGCWLLISFLQQSSVPTHPCLLQKSWIFSSFHDARCNKEHSMDRVRSCEFSLCLCHYWTLWPWLNQLAYHNFGFFIYKAWIIPVLLLQRIAVQIKGNHDDHAWHSIHKGRTAYGLEWN